MSQGLGWLLYGLAVGLAWLLTGQVRRYAERRLMDLPNARSSHRQPTPRGGGLAIVLVFSLALAGLAGLGRVPWPLFMALAGFVPLAAIGFVDDHGHVPARWRFLVQLAAAVWALAWLGDLSRLTIGGHLLNLGGIGHLLAALWIVWMINLFNFMDGIDGIAGLEAMSVAASAALLAGTDAAVAGPSLALAAATGGFLIWNWPPAKIFMGDVGSGALGFVLAVLALWSAGQGTLSLGVWWILAAVFLVDATLTLLIRLGRGERWYEAHRSHAYQHVARRRGAHRPVTLGVFAINVLWLLPLAWLAAAHPWLEPVALAMAILPLALTAYRLGAGRP